MMCLRFFVVLAIAIGWALADPANDTTDVDDGDFLATNKSPGERQLVQFDSAFSEDPTFLAAFDDPANETEVADDGESPGEGQLVQFDSAFSEDPTFLAAFDDPANETEVADDGESPGEGQLVQFDSEFNDDLWGVDKEDDGFGVYDDDVVYSISEADLLEIQEDEIVTVNSLAYTSQPPSPSGESELPQRNTPTAGRRSLINRLVGFMLGESVRTFNAERDVVFRLYTQNNWKKDQILDINNVDSIRHSNFNALHPVRIIIAGWLSDSSTYGVANTIRRAYLERGVFNIIVLDWEAGSQGLYYPDVRYNIHAVALQLSYLINVLHYQFHVSLNEIYFIGHGLGAHVAGIAGKYITDGRVNTIFGLDPPLPLFSYEDDSDRLGPNDASYVEVIHTAAGDSSFFFNIGTADYYVNGGLSQPSCLGITGICSHQRAVDYFAESLVSPAGFYGAQCQSFSEIVYNNCTENGPRKRMGGEPSNAGHAKGVYYVSTSPVKPFAKGLI